MLVTRYYLDFLILYKYPRSISYMANVELNTYPYRTLHIHARMESTDFLYLKFWYPRATGLNLFI